jgi:hypothetical protein
MLMRWAWINHKKIAPFVSGAFGIVLALQVVWNFGAVDQRGAYQFDDYARAGLESLPPNAIVISKTWDVFVGPASYLQGCEGIRKDVTVIDYHLLHDRHWYASQLRAQDPALSAALGNRLVDWEQAVYDFDVRGKVDPRILQPRFDAVYLGILSQVAQRPIFIDVQIYDAIGRREIAVPGPLLGIPEAYFIRLEQPALAQAYHPATLPTREIRFGGDPAEYETQLLRQQLAQVWALRADYEMRAGHAEAAADWQARVTKLVEQAAAQ